ncbi:MAG: lactate utilization protein [Verrucomicrobiae bacterium]|nr:lactate utilization protein [Verrucomicrobiae bacterium]MDW8343765.1 lactate utilization protein [Verrucomicrobiae bacterium]
MNFARANILRRIRAVRARERIEAGAVPERLAECMFAPVTDPVAQFEAEFVAQRGELVTDIGGFLKEFTRVVCDGSEAASALRCRWPGLQPVGSMAELARADLAVTGCEWLVAQTGSVVVAHRAISVLPPVHLVVARRAQVVADLATVFDRLRERYGGRWPDAVTLITGPSRTADIEKILVMGAHGPKRLALYWLEG